MVTPCISSALPRPSRRSLIWLKACFTSPDEQHERTTPPTSVLWIILSERSLTATGKPISSATLVASLAVLADFDTATLIPYELSRSETEEASSQRGRVELCFKADATTSSAFFLLIPVSLGTTPLGLCSH